MSSDLAFEPVHVLSARVASGDLSPVDLMECLLDRIAAHDEKLHAFVTVYGDDARLAAAAAAKAVRSGHAVGPLPLEHCHQSGERYESVCNGHVDGQRCEKFDKGR